jgi:rod shape-determining protein MreB
VEEALAASVGCQIPIADEHAHSIIDIGGGTTDIAFITGGKITIGKSIKVAGDAMDEAIIHYVKLKYSLLVGQPTAELTKITLADAYPGKEVFHVVRGRDLESGLPRSVRLTNYEVSEALSPLFEEIAETVSDLLKESPPELVSDVLQSGIVLTGGGALIRNLALYFEKELDVSVTISDDPLTSVVRGVGKLLTDRGLLRAVEYKSKPLI